MVSWNTSLIRQYGGPGPRYTSYPPATSFHAGVSEDDFWLALDEGNVMRRPLSLYIHIPFLRQRLLLLRLQPHCHCQQGTGCGVSTAPETGNKAQGDASRQASAGDANALGRRHPHFPG